MAKGRRVQRCPVCNLDMSDVPVTIVTEVGQFEFSNGLIINWLNSKKYHGPGM